MTKDTLVTLLRDHDNRPVALDWLKENEFPLLAARLGESTDVTEHRVRFWVGAIGNKYATVTESTVDMYPAKLVDMWAIQTKSEMYPIALEVLKLRRILH